MAKAPPFTPDEIALKKIFPLIRKLNIGFFGQTDFGKGRQGWNGSLLNDNNQAVAELSLIKREDGEWIVKMELPLWAQQQLKKAGFKLHERGRKPDLKRK